MVRSLLLPLLLLCFLLPAISSAAEVLPAAPIQYFNDYAGVVAQPVADQFNQQLAQFERDTSNQIVVAVYPKMQSDSDIADYTFRVKETWHVGQKNKNNGAVLFVFIQDRKLFIQVNYGLEGALPDATCKQIIDQEITPHFKTGDYTAGLRAGIDSILAATRGEYKGTGHTVADAPADAAAGKMIYGLFWAIIIGFLLLGPLLFFLNHMGGTFYQKHARALSFAENAYLGIWRVGFYMLMFGGRSSSGGDSGSGSRGGGGGFSGGGGTGGGGGAGGSW
ncbi:MAG: TPM domain-containing protein [Planctomycetota bacterium]|nr:TPM domain-containing protein [Planctomycetota bacterium]